MNYEIKKVSLDDCDLYLKVNLQCWQESYNEIISSSFLNKISNEIEESIKIKKEKFSIKKNEYLLIVDKEVVGMTSIGKSRIDEYSNIGEIYSLYILDKVKNKGFGKILFNHNLKKLEELGYTSMVLGCLKDNIKANGFYKHMGGILVSTRIIKIGVQELEENIYYFEKI